MGNNSPTFESVPLLCAEILTRISAIERQLNANDAAPLPDILNVAQAAEFLGIAVPTVYSKCCRREIPHSKKNRKLYFSRVKLQNWLQSNERGAA